MQLLHVLLTVAVAAGNSSSTLLERQASLTLDMLRMDLKKIAEDSEESLFPLPARDRADLSLQEPAKDQEQSGFNDVNGTAWYAPYVRSASEKGFMAGYRDSDGKKTGVFGPERAVILGEVATLALRGSGLSEDCGNSTNAAANGQWYEGAVACAEQNDWVVFSDGTVDPKRKATRAEVIVTLLQAFGIRPAPLSDIGPFTDVTPSTQYAGAIAKAKYDGIVRGYTDENGNPSGAFGPEDTVTRAEMAKILLLTIEQER